MQQTQVLTVENSWAKRYSQCVGLSRYRLAGRVQPLQQQSPSGMFVDGARQAKLSRPCCQNRPASCKARLRFSRSRALLAGGKTCFFFFFFFFFFLSLCSCIDSVLCLHAVNWYCDKCIQCSFLVRWAETDLSGSGKHTLYKFIESCLITLKHWIIRHKLSMAESEDYDHLN